MINLGLTQRWGGRHVGAVERAKAALRRRGGVRAANYVLHIDKLGSEKTLCGRDKTKVNRFAGQPSRDELAEAACRRCARAWVDAGMPEDPTP